MAWAAPRRHRKSVAAFALALCAVRTFLRYWFSEGQRHGTFDLCGSRELRLLEAGFDVVGSFADGRDFLNVPPTRDATVRAFGRHLHVERFEATLRIAVMRQHQRRWRSRDIRENIKLIHIHIRQEPGALIVIGELRPRIRWHTVPASVGRHDHRSEGDSERSDAAWNDSNSKIRIPFDHGSNLVHRELPDGES